ncbi:ATPase family AAA domain-containing protein 3A [Colletotrichum spaethianum]|uniref:ATPase family AAA domain-containing protein 3A n=1 Tax=Colletotrichum spaethianum TaxID=700344 RepID=A0AA37LD28_9PEZI|nr:ATPase family AAA domain-containing protein 3A [Colletotrichum spaethianum]GKT44370.1 ATPase family AAA domain-containing protein 3A [Colletotrichum spaethianum]
MSSLDVASADRQLGSAPADPVPADEVEPGKDSATAAVAPVHPAKSSRNPKDSKKKSVKNKVAKQSKKKAKKHKKASHEDDEDSSASATEDDSDESANDDISSDSDSTSSDSEGESSRRKAKSKKHSGNTTAKKARSVAPRSTKKSKPSKKRDPSPSPSSSSSDTDSDSAADSADEDDEDEDGLTKVPMTNQQMQLFQQWQRNNGSLSLGNNNAPSFWPPPPRRGNLGLGDGGLGENPVFGNRARPRGRAAPPSSKKKSKLDFKRVDQVWDSAIHQYKLQDTAATTSETQYDAYVLQIRRTFDWEGKYKATLVDIKSKVLRECLQEVMGNIKGVSLVDETPKLNPNMLFLYLEDFRKYDRQLKKTAIVGTDKKERKKHKKHIKTKRQHLKVLLKYLDKDYAHVKKSLYPMLENGLITFELLWALFKPNTLVYTTTYGSPDEPRVFKVEQAEKLSSMTKGEFYWVDGKYLEFDGKQFGYGTLCEEVPEFRGARKINSLSAFSLDFHKDKVAIKAALIDRGKKFVQLGGVHYRSHQGLAYYKKKKAVIKVNINGRVMVDPAIHRRINPNYQVSVVRPKDHDVLSDSEDSDDEKPCGQGSDSENGCGSDDDACGKMVTKVVRDAKGNVRMVQVPKSDLEESAPAEKLELVKDVKADGPSDASRQESEKSKEVPEFSEEDYLIASSVVLGFSFSEKLWLEFTVSGVKDIQWNDSAYDSLVLEPKQKDIVKALVESHKYHAAESIDDVIQGKGKGLVAVLHGPPGTGKTLTAEGISELLKCPLYMASAGELGTDSRYLESELQKILDICHAWGAILLLDEADVFLEKRNLHEIARNALVSIFLRQLEYFQGILFLTTNRVETFDDAFQSRIHIALRYESLTYKAKKSIFKIFIERVRVLEKVDLKPFSDEDYDSLATHDLNGRQIKNTVRTAQALAVNKGEPLSMEHIKQVLDVQNSFDLHLKGGESYKDAMRSYY